MRIAAHVVLAYVLILFIGCLWRFVPLGRMTPDIVALSAVYLGLTARERLAPATAGAVVLGYLGDLLFGTPRGFLAVTAGIVCIFGQLIHRRLLVRGVVVTAAVSFVTGLVSGLIGLGLRAYADLIPARAGVEFGVIAGSAAITGILGPPLFRLFRALDARFGRTYRAREVN
ncbi:MAG: hypothetical protein MJE77_18415 [Proteobacteria bacterium]|nr:hypothetical protein [Pseudomonadota bacterium]